MPYVIMGEDIVDPLRDERVAKVVRKQGIKYYCVTPCAFGGNCAVEHGRLRSPNGIATNSSGQFIVGDIYEVKIFDPTGQFIQHFSLPLETNIFDVATDNRDNIYVLVSGVFSGSVVCEFSNTTDLHQTFPLREDGFGLTVTNNKVLVLSKFNVDVYDTDGLFVCSFGEGTFEQGRFGGKSITAANDGRVMVVDRHDNCVHIFSEDGHHLDKFQVQRYYGYPRIAFHMLSEHVAFVSQRVEPDIVVVEIFTKDGVFVRSTAIYICELIDRITGMTVTRDGRIAVVGTYFDCTPKLLVI